MRVRIGRINPAVGRADDASRGARGNDDTLSEQSWNRYIGGRREGLVPPRRYVSYIRTVGEAAARLVPVLAVAVAVAVEAAPGPRNSRDTSRGDAAHPRRTA